MALSRWQTVQVLFLSVCFMIRFSDQTLINVLIESIKTDLDLTDSQIGLALGPAFTIIYAMLALPLARLADSEILRRGTLLTVCMVIFCLTTAATGLVQTFAQFMASRVGSAAAEAAVVPIAQSFIGATMSGNYGAAIGLLYVGMPLGSMLGSGGGGTLSDWLSWRAAAMAIGLFGLPIAALAPCVLREPEAERPEPERRVGRTSGAATTAKLPFADASPERHRERLARSPIGCLASVRTLLCQRNYLLVLIALASTGLANQPTVAWLAPFYSRRFGLSSGGAGRLLSLPSLPACIGPVIGGRLIDRLARHSVRWYGWVPALAAAAAVPFYVGMLVAPTAALSGACLVASQFFHELARPGLVATVQLLSDERGRTMAAAVPIFVNNVLAGVGILTLGLLSDALAPTLGPVEGLRVPLLLWQLTWLVPFGTSMLLARSLAEGHEPPPPNKELV